MSRIRTVFGILLILISISGLILWEWKGRETLMTEPVLVAKEKISEGTIVNSTMFVTRGIPRENLLDGALTEEEASSIRGKKAARMIAENGQIILDYFQDNEFYFADNESIFVINPAWIAMRSSALRRGDLVDIYGNNGIGLMGTFKVAYVKDASEREVRNADTLSEGMDGTGMNRSGSGGFINTGYDILERPDSTSVIDHIEIITTFEKYESLVDQVTGANGTTPAALIIVQRGESN